MSLLNTNASFFYKCTYVLVHWFFKTLYDYTTSGNHHIPLDEGVILASNHTSFYDPPAIGGYSPRQLSYFARDTLFKGIPGICMRSLNAIPVTRNSADIKSLKAIFNVLKSKGAILIFPEGTRSSDGKLAEPKPGIGMIACKAKATVIPTRIMGTFEVWGRQKKLPLIGGSIHICFGPPMTVSDIDPGPEHPERYKEASRRIMNEIAKLKAPEPIIV